MSGDGLIPQDVAVPLAIVGIVVCGVALLVGLYCIVVYIRRHGKGGSQADTNPSAAASSASAQPEQPPTPHEDAYDHPEYQQQQQHPVNLDEYLGPVVPPHEHGGDDRWADAEYGAEEHGGYDGAGQHEAAWDDRAYAGQHHEFADDRARYADGEAGYDEHREGYDDHGAGYADEEWAGAGQDGHAADGRGPHEGYLEEQGGGGEWAEQYEGVLHEEGAGAADARHEEWADDARGAAHVVPVDELEQGWHDEAPHARAQAAAPRSQPRSGPRSAPVVEDSRRWASEQAFEALAGPSMSTGPRQTMRAPARAAPAASAAADAVVQPSGERHAAQRYSERRTAGQAAGPRSAVSGAEATSLTEPSTTLAQQRLSPTAPRAPAAGGALYGPPSFRAGGAVYGPPSTPFGRSEVRSVPASDASNSTPRRDTIAELEERARASAAAAAAAVALARAAAHAAALPALPSPPIRAPSPAAAPAPVAAPASTVTSAAPESPTAPASAPPGRLPRRSPFDPPRAFSGSAAYPPVSPSSAAPVVPSRHGDAAASHLSAPAPLPQASPPQKPSAAPPTRTTAAREPPAPVISPSARAVPSSDSEAAAPPSRRRLQQPPSRRVSGGRDEGRPGPTSANVSVSRSPAAGTFAGEPAARSMTEETAVRASDSSGQRRRAKPSLRLREPLPQYGDPLGDEQAAPPEDVVPVRLGEVSPPAAPAADLARWREAEESRTAAWQHAESSTPVLAQWQPAATAYSGSAHKPSKKQQLRPPSPEQQPPAAAKAMPPKQAPAAKPSSQQQRQQPPEARPKQQLLSQQFQPDPRRDGRYRSAASGGSSADDDARPRRAAAAARPPTPESPEAPPDEEWVDVTYASPFDGGQRGAPAGQPARGAGAASAPAATLTPPPRATTVQVFRRPAAAPQPQPTPPSAAAWPLPPPPPAASPVQPSLSQSSLRAQPPPGGYAEAPAFLPPTALPSLPWASPPPPLPAPLPFAPAYAPQPLLPFASAPHTLAYSPGGVAYPMGAPGGTGVVLSRAVSSASSSHMMYPGGAAGFVPVAYSPVASPPFRGMAAAGARPLSPDSGPVYAMYPAAHLNVTPPGMGVQHQQQQLGSGRSRSPAEGGPGPHVWPGGSPSLGHGSHTSAGGGSAGTLTLRPMPGVPPPPPVRRPGGAGSFGRQGAR